VFALTVFLVCIPTVAYANVTWPVLFRVAGYNSLYIVILGLLIEYLFLRSAFKLRPGNALLADVIMNLFSAGSGFLLLIVGMIGWTEFPLSLSQYMHGMSARVIFVIFMTVLIGACINALLEAAVLSSIFNRKPFSKVFIYLFIANLLSAGSAIFII